MAGIVVDGVAAAGVGVDLNDSIAARTVPQNSLKAFSGPNLNSASSAWICSRSAITSGDSTVSPCSWAVRKRLRISRLVSLLISWLLAINLRISACFSLTSICCASRSALTVSSVSWALVRSAASLRFFNNRSCTFFKSLSPCLPVTLSRIHFFAAACFAPVLDSVISKISLNNLPLSGSGKPCSASLIFSVLLVKDCWISSVFSAA